MTKEPGDARSRHRSAAISRLRRVAAAGLILHGIAYVQLAEPSMTSGASGLAQLAADVSAFWWGHWYISVPVAVMAYSFLERCFIERMPLYLLHEVVRFAAVLWLAAILALWYPWHRACNCLEYLSETTATVATLPGLAVLLFGIGVLTQRRPEVRP